MVITQYLQGHAVPEGRCARREKVVRFEEWSEFFDRMTYLPELSLPFDLPIY